MTEYPEPEPNYDFSSALQSATRYPYFTWTMVVINVAVFLAMGVAGVGWVTTDTTKALAWGADYGPYTLHGEWWRLLTSAFIHFGAIHIAMNVWALVNLGRLTERFYGNFFFLLIYMFCALASSLVAVWWAPRAVEAGASGAVFGVGGATLAYLIFQNRSFPKVVSKSLLSSMMMFIAFNVYFGLTNQHISNSAHMGGLVSGFVIGAIVCRPLDPQRRGRQTLARMAAGLVFGCGILAAGFYLVPKSPDDPHIEEAFYVAAENARSRANEVNDRYKEIVNQQTTLSEAEIADRLDRDVVPELDHIASDLAKLQLKDGTETKGLRDLWVRFLETRRDADRAWSQEMRARLAGNFPEAAKKRAEQDRLWKQSVDLQTQVQLAISKHPGT